MKRTRSNRAAICAALALLLSLLPGCKKGKTPAQESPRAAQQPPATPPTQSPKSEVEPPGAPPQLTDRNAEPERSATPPADIFDLKAHPDASILTAIDINKLSPTEQEYGIAPKRTKDVEYVDNVIVMEEGDKAIRSVGTNGLSWTFDANAPHVSEFQEGKVVFATGRAVGRIIGLKREGNNVSAYLGPVQLTDVIKKGHFAMSQPIDVDNMLAYVAPDYPEPPDNFEAQKSSTLYREDESHVQKAVVVSRFEHGKWTPVSLAQTYGDGRRITYRKYATRWSQARVSLTNVSPLKLVSPIERLRLSIPPSGDPPFPTDRLCPGLRNCPTAVAKKPCL